MSSTGLSRGLGSPLRSAHLSTCAPVEMTVFGFDAFALVPVAGLEPALSFRPNGF